FYLTYLLIGTLLFSFIAGFTLFAVYSERKVAGFVQDRLCPMETGRYGSLQTLADILKLIQKEYITPAVADKVLFAAAPVIIFIAVFLGFAVMPWAPGLTPSGLYLGLFFVIAIISVDAIGLLMAGWGSNNKFSLLGSMRAVAQIVSYEIPSGLAL